METRLARLEQRVDDVTDRMAQLQSVPVEIEKLRGSVAGVTQRIGGIADQMSEVVDTLEERDKAVSAERAATRRALIALAAAIMAALIGGAATIIAVVAGG